MIPGLDFSSPLFPPSRRRFYPRPPTSQPLTVNLPVDLDVTLQTSRRPYPLYRLSARADRQSGWVTRHDGPPILPSVFPRRQVLDLSKLDNAVSFFIHHLLENVRTVVSQHHTWTWWAWIFCPLTNVRRNAWQMDYTGLPVNARTTPQVLQESGFFHRHWTPDQLLL